MKPVTIDCLRTKMLYNGRERKREGGP